MYNYIKGRFVYADENVVVVEAGGIGYELFASPQTATRLGKVGDECKIYCYLNVKEDEMSLFGFADLAEKELFVKLINVSGIGCKMAISILGSGTLSDILTAIASADVAKLSKIKGIGKKTAERLVVELRDKVGVGGGADFPIAPSAGAVAVNGEAVDALIGLGFTRQEAQASVARVEKAGMTAEEIVFAALKG